MAKSIIIIDDSEVNLLLLNSIFESDRNLKVFLEKESTRAMELIRKEIPELIVLDLMMPKVDGFQILEQLQADAALRNIPVLIISARQDAATIKRTMAYNVIGYIKKPINLSEIEYKIRGILHVPA